MDVTLMDRATSFMDQFLAAEAEALEASGRSNMDEFNAKLTTMNRFVSASLQNGFGMLPREVPRPGSEHVQPQPPDKRFLFRIDAYRSETNGVQLMHYVSLTEPDGFKSYSICLLVRDTGDALQIAAKYFLSNRGTGEDYQWRFGGGDHYAMHKTDGLYLLNEAALGEKFLIRRLLEPSDDPKSKALYWQD